jgi:hypothetical protein
MDIMELDEAQGLTPQMVREWLLANQWEPRGSSAAHLYYQCGSGEISEALLHEDLGWVVDLLAQSYERSVQSILREINPRMRPGWPSEEEIKAHDQRGGLWICDHGRGPSFGRFAEGERFEGIALEMSRDALERLGARFWPCDQHGNKTRRGA